MATTTPRIGLTKPDGTDLVDIAVLNTNFDKIDSNIASTKIQATKPSTANAGDLWWDSDTGTLYLYYVDANSSQWVAATSDPINIGVVANQTERDAQYPTPAQGMSVYRTDLGVTQRYYGLFNSSTNPGGRDVAGWYDTDKSIGLVPIRPATVNYSGGTATTNSLGEITFSGTTSISLNNVFSSKYNNYKIIIKSVGTSDGGANFKLRASGTDLSTSNYWSSYIYTGGNGAYSTPFPSLALDTISGNVSQLWIDLDVQSPFLSANYKTIKANIGGVVHSNGAQSFSIRNCWINQTNQYDGFTITTTATTFSGTVQVFGYNF